MHLNLRIRIEALSRSAEPGIIPSLKIGKNRGSFTQNDFAPSHQHCTARRSPKASYRVIQGRQPCQTDSVITRLRQAANLKRRKQARAKKSGDGGIFRSQRLHSPSHAANRYGSCCYCLLGEHSLTRRCWGCVHVWLPMNSTRRHLTKIARCSPSTF